MYYERTRLVKGLQALIHIAVNATTFGFAYQIRNTTILADRYGSIMPFNEYVPSLVLVCLLWPVLFLSYKLYKGKLGEYRIINHIKTIFASATGCGFISIILFFQRDLDVSRLFLLVFFVINSCGLVITNELYFYVVKKAIHNPQHRKRVLVVMSANYKHQTLKALHHESDASVKVVDIIIVKNDEQIENFDRLLIDNITDEVLFLLTRDDMTYLEDYIICCETMGVTANVVATFYELPHSSIYVGKLADIPVLKYTTLPQSQGALFVKRVADILVAIIGLTLTMIVSVVLVPVISIDSKGPVIFKQTRIGKNGRPFTLYKFRSMCNDAEYLKASLSGQNEMKGAMFKIENDPRITKVGAFIRKTSLDELPQFWNVLRGDMSLIGTRPPLPDEVETYKRHHWKRLSMQPGLTGIWQTSGRNKIMDFDVIAQMDSEYIDTWSLRLDLKLFLKTIKVVLCGYGAS